MKKLLIAATILGITAASAACSAKPAMEAANNIPEKKPVQAQVQETPKQEEKENTGLLKLAYEGKIDRIQTSVGGTLQQVIAELGEPIELGHFEGSSFVSYENVTFMLNDIIESTKADAEITGIIASEGYELYNIRVGMSMDEIKQILGAAQQEYKDGEEAGDMWKLEYDCGNYKVTFFFPDKASPSTSAYLSKL